MSASTTACAASEPSARTGRLIKCQVNVTTATGAKHSYTALFQSTFGAVMDALDRFGISKVSVEAMRE